MMPAACRIENEFPGWIYFAPTRTQTNIGPAIGKTSRFLVARRNRKSPLRIDKPPTPIPPYRCQALGKI